MALRRAALSGGRVKREAAGGSRKRKASKAVAKPSSQSRSKSTSKSKAASRAQTKAGARGGTVKPVTLLQGGNPQIAKADGDAPVQAYLAALPGWKRDVGRRLDALITRAVPHVRKAVKWNSPLYGVDGQGWFLGVHAYAKYLKLAFFRGTSLRPLPPVPSKVKGSRYVDVREGDALDEAQLTAWVKQAAAIPGWVP